MVPPIPDIMPPDDGACCIIGACCWGGAWRVGVGAVVARLVGLLLGLDDDLELPKRRKFRK